MDALASGGDEGRGKLQTTLDPEISEWGNPAEVKLCRSRTEYIGPGEQTGGSETSQYPLEEKANAIS